MSDHADVEGLLAQRDGWIAERNAMARHVAELRAEVDHLRTVGARADGERMQEVLRLRAEVEKLRATLGQQQKGDPE